MSFFNTLKIDVEKFVAGTGTDVEKFATAFSKLFKQAPSVLQTIDNFVTEAAPIITGAVTLADPLLEPEVAGALSIAETGLAAIEAAAANAQSGNSLLANLQNFATSVPALLTGLQIKNPALQAAVTRVVALVTGEAKVLIPAVQSWVAQIEAASATPTPAPAPTPAPEAPSAPAA